VLSEPQTFYKAVDLREISPAFDASDVNGLVKSHCR
jgi:hypothetical protein